MKRERIERLLPEVFQSAIASGSPLDALLWVMEDLHQPDEDLLASVDALVDPHRTLHGLLPFLTDWVDVGHLLGAERTLPDRPGRVRNLIADAADITRGRGTRRSLLHALETLTGSPDFELEERGHHLVVHIPDDQAINHALVERIVRSEKPAHLTVEFVYR